MTEEGMRVDLLMAILKTMPPEAQCFYLYDCFATPGIKRVWKTKDGRVIMNDGDCVARAEDQPE